MEGSLGLWMELGLLRSTLLVAAAALAGLVLRKAPASARHMAYAFAVAGLLLTPVLSPVLPSWRVQLASRPDTPGLPTVSRADAAPVLPPAPIPPNALAAAPARASAVSPSGTARAAPLARVSPGAVATRMLSVPSGEVLFGLWAIGLSACLVRFVVGWIRRRNLVKLCSPAPEGLLRLKGELAAGVGVREPVPLLMLPGGGALNVPMAWGFPRGYVALPEGAAEWPQERLTAALTHELGHVARHDWVFQQASELACAVYWFHPGVWWLASRLRSEAEEACDDVVLSRGVSPSTYARELLEVAQMIRKGSRTFSTAINMARSPALARRVEAVLDGSRRRGPLGRGVLAVALAVAAGLVLPISSLRVSASPSSRRAPAAKAVRAPGPEARGSHRETVVARTKRASATPSRSPKATSVARVPAARSAATDAALIQELRALRAEQALLRAKLAQTESRLRNRQPAGPVTVGTSAADRAALQAHVAGAQLDLEEAAALAKDAEQRVRAGLAPASELTTAQYKMRRAALAVDLAKARLAAGDRGGRATDEAVQPGGVADTPELRRLDLEDSLRLAEVDLAEARDHYVVAQKRHEAGTVTDEELATARYGVQRSTIRIEGLRRRMDALARSEASSAAPARR